MQPVPGLDWMIQGGALGLLAYVLVWLTRKLNGSIDRLRQAVEENTTATRELGERLSRLEEGAR
jgi:hypothetical protein